MPVFSMSSKQKLATCDLPLQELFNSVISDYDCVVLEGHRPPERQFELFKQGRELVNGIWKTIDPSKIVTQLDGFRKMSKHNFSPSKAIDVAPYPLDWDDIDRFNDFIDFVLNRANLMEIPIINGRDFSFKDYPHYELKED